MADTYSSPEEAGAVESDFIAFNPPADITYKAHMVGGDYTRLASDHPFNAGKLEAQIRFRLAHDVEGLGEDLNKMVGGQLVRLRAVTNSEKFLRFCRTFSVDPKTFNPKEYPEMPVRLRLKVKPGTKKITDPDTLEETLESTLYVDVDQVFKAEG